MSSRSVSRTGVASVLDQLSWTSAQLAFRTSVALVLDQLSHTLSRSVSWTDVASALDKLSLLCHLAGGDHDTTPRLHRVGGGYDYTSDC